MDEEKRTGAVPGLGNLLMYDGDDGGSGGREVRTYDSRFDHLQSLSSVLGSNPGTFSDPRRKSSARE